MNKSFGVEAGKDRLAFCRPLSTRIGSGMMGILIAGMLPIIPVGNYLTSGQHPVMDFGIWCLFGLLESFCLAGGAILVCGSGPDDLYIDLKQHTYRYVFGWPIRPQVREGQWQDMAGVYTQQWAGPGSVIVVGIAWNGQGRQLPLFGKRRTWFGMFKGLGRLDRANQLAIEMATVLGLFIVESPFPKSTL